MTDKHDAGILNVLMEMFVAGFVCGGLVVGCAVYVVVR